MATSKPTPQQLSPLDGGFRLGDFEALRLAALNWNSGTSTYAIAAAGTTQATATPLKSVFNQVDTASASQGVNLPLSTGRRNTPCQYCVVVNNTSVSLTVYPFQGTTETINGASSFVMAAGSLVVFATVKGGAWFAEGGNTVITSAQMGTFTANGATPVTVANANITANSQVLVTLKTVGGTVGTSAPNVRTITVGTGFTIAGIASDTSVYNYAIIG